MLPNNTKVGAWIMSLGVLWCRQERTIILWVLISTAIFITVKLIVHKVHKMLVLIRIDLFVRLSGNIDRVGFEAHNLRAKII